MSMCECDCWERMYVQALAALPADERERVCKEIREEAQQEGVLLKMLQKPGYSGHGGAITVPLSVE